MSKNSLEWLQTGFPSFGMHQMAQVHDFLDFRNVPGKDTTEPDLPIYIHPTLPLGPRIFLRSTPRELNINFQPNFANWMITLREVEFKTKRGRGHHIRLEDLIDGTLGFAVLRYWPIFHAVFP